MKIPKKESFFQDLKSYPHPCCKQDYVNSLWIPITLVEILKEYYSLIIIGKGLFLFFFNLEMSLISLIMSVPAPDSSIIHLLQGIQSICPADRYRYPPTGACKYSRPQYKILINFVTECVVQMDWSTSTFSIKLIHT